MFKKNQIWNQIIHSKLIIQIYIRLVWDECFLDNRAVQEINVPNGSRDIYQAFQWPCGQGHVVITKMMNRLHKHYEFLLVKETLLT